MLFLIGICAHIGALYYANALGESMSDHSRYCAENNRPMRAYVAKVGLYQLVAAIALTLLGIACIWGGA